MGCNGSTPIVADAGSPKAAAASSASPPKKAAAPIPAAPRRPPGSKKGKKKAPSGGASSPELKSRARLDSWALEVRPLSPPLTKEDSNGRAPEFSVERQWKVLWESHSPLLVDPADVPSVLDTLMNHVINQLSPVELTLVQRRVRSLVKALPNTGNKSTMGRVFSSSPNLAEAEAKNAAQTQHLLTEHIVAHKFFRTNVVIGSTNVIQNTFTLLLYLSDSLWPRMAQVALHTAGASGLILDVNKQEKDWNAKMPKPSKVPDLQESPDLPQGVTLQALCCLLALARRPKYRQQRLQLLFYLCLDSAVLSNFLAKHPAGGAPCWLLEVGQAQVVSMASLTHYHYYGNAFTPLLADSTPTFIRSKSRAPLHVSAAAVQRVVANLLSGKTISTGLDLSSGSGATARRNSNSLPYKKNGASPTASTENGHKESEAAGASSQVPLEPDTHLMRALHADGERTEYSAFTDGPDGRLQSLSTKLAGAAKEASSEEWTLTDFALWADECLTETVLDTCFHNIFGKGLFPAPLLEKRLVQQEWLEWQTWTEQNMHAIRTDLEKGTIDVITESVRALLDINASQNGSNHHRPVSETALPWGNLGGLDGGGGLGRGMFYCVDKKWWDAWASYVGWTWQSQKPRPRKSVERPGLLSNEDLLEADPEIVTRGTMGSYEMMRPGLKRNRDYVLVPPGVWSILFELYSGGPPLPRMVIPSHRKMSESSVLTESNGTKSDAGKDDLDSVMEGIGSSVRVPKLLDSLSVETNPWVLQCSLCDPQQPYRRGDAGHMNIRIQAMPHQPLWRLLVETFTRFPLASLNAFDEGVCKGRLWKKMEASTTKDPVPRYGPWTLLCKNREARMPLLSESSGWRSKIEEYVTEWQGYADSSTVEESGLRDGSILMLEIAVLNKSNELIWPREAAAKAGRVKRLAEEDKLFRNTLLGLDKDGHMMLKPPKLVGMVVDAMDSTGRWHHATIVEVDVIDDDTEVEDDENEEGDGKTSEPVSHKKVKVSFKESDGHYSWIDVESDRLAKAGRFTSDTDSQSASPSNKGSTAASPKEGEAKTKGTSLAKKPSGADSSNHGAENIQVNPFPGFGACGLTNLGNTCYQNSAIQCMGYMPLLRSYLLSAQFKASGDLNKDNPLGTGGKLLEEFADLMRILWSAKLGEKSPSRFRSQLGKTNQQFSGADQQDAQEFLNYMLDVLHEDSNRVRKKPYVEALEDAWVQRMPLPRIGEEAWRRFLRRNQSIMANVGMGQVLNTVTCPVCNFSSRNFDPFNLLSITIPTVADVIFQVTVFRRASFANNAWILNKPDRRDDKRTQRFSRKSSKTVNGPPSETYVAEQYVIAMSRLADSSDLRIQIQNMCNIPGGRLKLCRAEEVIDEDAAPDSIFRRQIEMTPLTEKEGPCSHLARKKQPDEEIAAPTMILAFESTLRGRPLKKGKEEETAEDTADEEDDDAENGGARSFPTPEEEKEILRILETYGDARECRSYDSNPHLLAQALSRSIWPQSESELLLRKGLRVDAKDSRGNWYPGSVIDIIDTESTASDADTGKDVKIRKIKGVVHFDNFSPKWDEEYSISDFETGKVQPLYSHAKPKPRPTEFIVHHRHVNASTDEFVQFGQSFYVQCHNEWTTARAGVQILSQAARFVRRSLAPVDTDDLSDEVDEVLVDQLERCHLSLSALIDLLVECDKDFVSTALGVERNGGDAQVSFENPAFNPTHLVRRFEKNLAILLDRIPFEVFVATHDVSPGNAKSTKLVEEKPFPFSLMRTMSNCMHLRQTVVLRWRSPKRTSPSRSPLLLYSHPQVEVHKAGLEVLKMANKINKEKARRTRPGSSGVDLGVCLTEFCKVQRLSLEDNWRCPRCKDFREGLQNMNLWRLPDLLTFHIKRFNMSARWREKLTTKVNFPLTGLDLNEWCHKESPAIQVDGDDSHVYDLVGVMNHYGSMTGGHYVATCRATACGKDGKEEVAYDFNGYGASTIESKGNDTSTGWRLSRPKAETNFQKEAAQVTAQSAAESAEPLWLQFDDELVEPIPPRSVVSEMAYVLFYRRRRITPSNIARYSTLE